MDRTSDRERQYNEDNPNPDASARTPVYTSTGRIGYSDYPAGVLFANWLDESIEAMADVLVQYMKRNGPHWTGTMLSNIEVRLTGEGSAEITIPSPAGYVIRGFPETQGKMVWLRNKGVIPLKLRDGSIIFRTAPSDLRILDNGRMAGGQPDWVYPEGIDFVQEAIDSEEFNSAVSHWVEQLWDHGVSAIIGTDRG